MDSIDLTMTDETSGITMYVVDMGDGVALVQTDEPDGIKGEMVLTERLWKALGGFMESRSGALAAKGA